MFIDGVNLRWVESPFQRIPHRLGCLGIRERLGHDYGRPRGQYSFPMTAAKVSSGDNDLCASGAKLQFVIRLNHNPA